MTHLVTENCINCKHTDCVEVCPVDCFYEGPNFLAINPDECIDCAVCIPECPVDAIVADTDSNIDVIFWTDLNKKLSDKWPNITKKKPALENAEKWKGVSDKIKLLKE
jgi:ferredoxin